MTTMCSADNTSNFLLDFIFHSFCHIVATLQSIFISCKSWERDAQLGYMLNWVTCSIGIMHIERCSQNLLVFKVYSGGNIVLWSMRLV